MSDIKQLIEELGNVTSDSINVHEALEVVINHLKEQIPSEIKDFSVGKKHGDKEDYIYIHVSGISYADISGSHKDKNPKGKGISIINEVKHKITQSDIDLVLCKIKEMFTKED